MLFRSTPAGPLEAALRDGRDVLLDIDTQGALSLRRLMPEAVLVFILPPGRAALGSWKPAIWTCSPKLLRRGGRVWQALHCRSN